KVRIINPYVGGGFSGKHEALDLDFAAAALSKKTGFPVKIVLSQDEVIAAFKQRHAKHVEIKIGMKKDGTLVACECKMIAEGGAYASVGPFNIVIFATSGLLLPYRMSHFKYEAHRVYTNKPWCGSVRGQSIPIARFAFESLFNMMIDDLGLDQLEVRKKNSILSGESTINKMTVGTAGMVEAIEKLGEMIGWDGRKKKKAPYRGIGIACSPQVSGARMGGHFGSSAVVKVDEDGGVCLIHGGTEIGQGCDTVLAQMAAEVIGVPVEEIRQMEEDSDVAVLEAGMFSSRCTFWAGHAVKRAAEDACQQLAEIAAPLLEASKDDIVFKNKTVFSRKNPERAIAFIDLVRNAYYTKGQPIYGRGSYSASNIPMPDLKTGEGDVTNAWAFFAQAVEVEVDPETGRVKVLKSVCTRDVGRPINPMLLDAQLEGGTVFTSGQALYEECCFDEKGRPLQNSFLDYKMPTVMEAPENEHFDIITDDPNGPFGAKGAGEGSNGTTLAAIANAVEDAIGV
ncbi:MAG: molybdopterin cofactor-binding domain-containing protein, partial [Dehalococcoidia bacterium]|nr:molybdopterin cofactor-binding domain-containing protein [Dehalococcoidia bacterium]